MVCARIKNHLGLKPSERVAAAMVSLGRFAAAAWIPRGNRLRPKTRKDVAFGVTCTIKDRRSLRRGVVCLAGSHLPAAFAADTLNAAWRVIPTRRLPDAACRH